jgi:DNA polymerase IIIc chi subunit
VDVPANGFRASRARSLAARGRDSDRLADSGDDLPHHDVLLNLADEWPPFFATFTRLLEVVGTDEADKEAARARYVFYKKRGYDIRVNDLDADRKQD